MGKTLAALKEICTKIITVITIDAFSSDDYHHRWPAEIKTVAFEDIITNSFH